MRINKRYKYMKIFNIVVVSCLIVLTIVIGVLLFKENRKNDELNTVLSTMETELTNTQKEMDTLNDILQTERDKNKRMEETISDLTDELSIANEKVSNMEEMGVPVYFTEEEVAYIAKTVWGEARGLDKLQQSGVVWCILNRLDNGYWGNTIQSVVTASGQFHGYSSSYPVTDEIREVVEDVLYRWNMEKAGATNVGRTVPERFLYFHSNGIDYGNKFTTYAGSGEVWTWDCWNPYE